MSNKVENIRDFSTKCPMNTKQKGFGENGCEEMIFWADFEWYFAIFIRKGSRRMYYSFDLKLVFKYLN